MTGQPRLADPEGMLDTVLASPEQWAGALEVAEAAPPPPDVDGLAAVVVAGMGGSGIAGDVAAVAAATSGRVPVVACKGYELPSWAGPTTLVVTVSFSGDTEETLACARAAVAAGAPWYAVCGGGALAALAAEHGALATALAAGGQPRANLANLAVPVLVALERAGAVPGITADLAGVSGHLAGRRDALAGRARELAAELADLVPLFVGGRGWMAVAALRGKCQVNENAERPAFWHELPELDHNEIVGWSALPERRRGFGLVELRSPADEHPRVRRRFDITGELVADRVGLRRAVEVDGPSPIARFAAAVLLVDLLSVQLALADGIDPTPVAPIAALKRRLAAER